MTGDPKTLWQQQDLEGQEMNLGHLRTLVDAQLTRARRARTLLVAASLVGVAISAFLAVSAPMALLRVGEGVMAAGFLLLLLLGWRRLSAAAPDTAETSVAFLRKTLVRRRDVARGGWVGLIAPLLPGGGLTAVALAVASGGDWRRLGPIVALVVIWLVANLVIQAREAAKVAAEIAELDRLSAA